MAIKNLHAINYSTRPIGSIEKNLEQESSILKFKIDSSKWREASYFEPAKKHYIDLVS